MAARARVKRRRSSASPDRSRSSSEARSGRPGDDWLIVAALAVGHLLLAGLVFDPTPHTGGDNAGYISLARALLERGDYADVWHPASPVHTKYPPVFPGILAAGMLLGLERWVGLKLMVVAFSTAAVVMTYLWLRRRHAAPFALGVAALLAASPGVLHLSHWILSDVPFWTFTMAGLWAFERLEPERRGRFAVAVAATALALYTRSAGLPLAVAAGGWLALERRWRALAAFAGVVVPLLGGWWLWGRVNGGESYVDQFLAVNPYAPALGRIGVLDLAGRVADNGIRYLGTHLPRMLVGLHTEPIPAVGIGVAALAVAGWARRVRASPSAAELFFPLYAGLLASWPAVWAGDRFLLPLLPLVLAYAGEAVLAAARRVRPSAVRAVGITAVVMAGAAMTPGLRAAAGFGSTCTRLYMTGDRYPCMAPAWREFFTFAERAGGALPREAAVISRKPRLFYAASGRPGNIYPFSEDPEAFFAFAREIGARYFMISRIDNLWPLYVAPAFQSRPDRFCVVATIGVDRATLFGILPAAGEAGGGEPEDAAGGFEPCPASFGRNVP